VLEVWAQLVYRGTWPGAGRTVFDDRVGLMVGDFKRGADGGAE